MARSTLELLLESIKDREEEPPDQLPALPQRPTSRARLPSRKRTSTLLFPDPNPDQSNGQVHALSPRLSGDAQGPFLSQRNAGQSTEGFNVAESFQSTANGQAKNTQDETHYTKNKESGKKDSVDISLPSSGVAYSSKKRRRALCCSFQKDSRVWVWNWEKWMLGVVQSAQDIEYDVRTVDQQLQRVPPERLFPANPELLDGVDDLVQLSYTNEPAILYNLQCRYNFGKFYTRAGPTLIAITAARDSKDPESNGTSTLDKLVTKDGDPHPYTIANNALAALKRDWSNQSIIISGEIGAGKTQSARSMLAYLVSRGGNVELQNLLLLSDTIMEAFGNAKTLNNANASCLGKLMEVRFDRSGKLSSAHLQIVSFEKSRVVRRAQGEKSYNVFYQLCQGADASLREKLKLRGGEEFDYLRKSGYDGLNGADCSSKFQSLLNALRSFGISEKVKHTIFSLLAGVLWLGNISSSAWDASNQAVFNAAKLLGCSSEELLSALCYEGSITDNVVAARDALACGIYVSLLHWLVGRINMSLNDHKASNHRSIYILDFPGYRFSENDGLEGLHMNYAHDNLHKFTQYHLFQQNEELDIRSYISTWNEISRDEECLDLLEQKLCPFLDKEESNLSRSSELGFVERLESLLAGSSCVKQLQNGHFSISHGFGEVTYDASRIWKDLRNHLSPQLCRIKDLAMSPLSERPLSNGFSEINCSIACPSYAASFRDDKKQVPCLMERLNNTTPHFIFCILPNDLLLSDFLQLDFVLRQLRIAKVIEAVQAFRSGYPKQMLHQDFATRFGILLGSSVTMGLDPLGTCVAVLQNLNVSPDVYRVGLTKLFFHSGQVEKLEQARESLLQGIVSIQKTFRGYRLRSQLEMQKSAATQLQACVRGWLARRGFIHAKGIANDERNSDLNWSPGLKKVNQAARLEAVSEEDFREGEKEKVKDFWQSDEEEMKKSGPEWAAAQAAIQRREVEILKLQESLKESERRWLDYEAKMKAMEEMWKHQITSLEQRLVAATHGADNAAEEPDNKQGGSDPSIADNSAVQSTPLHGTLTRNTADTTLGDPDITDGRIGSDPSKAALDSLTKELDHRTQVFNDDAKFLVEVKSGQIEASFKPDEELQKLKQRFDAWKKDYKGKLKETKGLLKKLGRGDSSDKGKKKWWSRK